MRGGGVGEAQGPAQSGCPVGGDIVGGRLAVIRPPAVIDTASLGHGGGRRLGPGADDLRLGAGDGDGQRFVAEVPAPSDADTVTV